MVPGSYGSQISWHRHRMLLRSALRTGRLYLQEMLLVLIYVKRLSRPEDRSAIGRILCQWKIPLTPAGIEPATFRFVAQHLNHCATAVRLLVHCIFLYGLFWRLCRIRKQEKKRLKFNINIFWIVDADCKCKTFVFCSYSFHCRYLRLYSWSL